MLRSKADWMEYGEKNSRFFLRLENRNRQIKNISTLLDDNDKEITEQEMILKEEQSFYKNLYTQPDDTSVNARRVAKAFFLDEDIPKISAEDKSACDLGITLEEISIALKSLKNGKTPGTDGFPPDFYKFFWKDLGDLVYESLSFALDKGEMSIDQKRGVINLIPKKDKDLRRLKNWRPISLLNTDYKILTKTMATRLKNVLPSVINADQVAYLKNRYIGQNIRTIIDVMEYTKANEEDGIIAFFDFEKAFDSIDWRVIDEALESFNIGQGFRKWVQTVYHNITSCVTNCGYSSEHFNMSRGVRQGCPLSAYLFIAVAEILAIKIRNNAGIEGIKIGDTEIKVIQMADDTTSFLRNEESLEEIVNTLEKFKTFAGLKLNLSKSEIMWLGKQRHSNKSPCGIKCVKGTKALGIFFSYEIKEMVEKNFNQKIKELKSLLALWGQRDLSIIGRILVFKSLAMSKVIYQCNNLETPDEIIKQLNTLAFDFVWQNKPNKVKRNTIISDYEHGGLRMLDVESFISAQKVMWVKRLIKPGQGSWKTFPNLLMGSVAGIHSFQCNTNSIKDRKIWPPFYQQIYAAWTKLKESPDNDPFNIRREILWCNKEIKIQKKEVLYREWLNKGIITIHDILQENGDFRTEKSLETEFGFKIDTMMFNGLKAAIPCKWKRCVKTMKIGKHVISNCEQPFVKCDNKLLALGIATNKDVYWELVRQKQVKPIVAQKWCERYNIPDDDWKSIFKSMTEIKESKMKAFQYKVLYNVIPCNHYLKKIGRSSTDKCPACDEVEDLIHYFIGCQGKTNIWLQIRRWWQGLTGQDINIDEQDIILGLHKRNFKIIKHEQLNIIMTTVKWKIHANKQSGDTCCLYQVLYSLKKMIKIEEMIAIRNGRTTMHRLKWGDIEDYLT